MSERKSQPYWLVAGAVLVLSLGVTATGWLVTNDTVESEARAKFEHAVADVTAGIVNRMAVYRQVLRGGVGLFMASSNVSREEWRAYIESQALEERFPAVQGVGFSLRIPPGEKAKHIAAIRAEGFPQYAIQPGGEREEYHSIIYLEPFSSRNLRDFGYDMFSNPIRRAAMERARDTGHPALSGRVTLVQEAETQIQAGFLMYVPFYVNGQPHNSVSERQRALVGFVYSPFRMNDVMENILGSKGDGLHLRIFDGEEADFENLLFDSDTGKATQSHEPKQTDSRVVVIDGRPWRLELASLPSFENSFDRHLPSVFLVASVTISGLLFAVILSLGSTQQETQRTSTRLARILEQSLNEIYMFDADTLRFIQVNYGARQNLGYSMDELNDMTAFDIKPEVPEERFVEMIAPLRDGTEKQLKFQTVHLRRDGSLYDVEVHLQLMREEEPHVFVAIINDISERKRQEMEMLEVNKQLTQSVTALEKHDREMTLLTRMNDLLMTCRDQEEAFHIIRASLEELFQGLSGALAVVESNEGELITKIKWGTELTTPDAFSLDDCWAVRQGRAHDVTASDAGLHCAHVTRTPSSGYLCLPLVVQNTMLGVLTVEVHDGDPGGRDAEKQLILTAGETIKLSLSNIGLRDLMREQATRDPLTKLYNRRFMEESLTREVARAKRHGTSLSVAIADLDFFKKINDRFGHDAGDHVLREVAKLLLKNLRTTDIACRFGGEEFVLILPGSSPEDARHHLETVLEKLEALKILQGNNVLSPVTMSLGLAAFSDSNVTGDSLISAADAALYLAKQGGRNRVVTENQSDPAISLDAEITQPQSPYLVIQSS